MNLTELYERHVDFVWRMVTRLGVESSLVEDAVQEVFLTLHRRREDFRGASSERTWIGGIAVRVARDFRRGHVRRERRKERLELVPPPASAGPHEALEDAEALREALRLLEQLDEDQRVVFVLTELEELSAREIAEMIGSNPNTVASRLRLARQRFEILLSQNEKERAS